MGLPVGWVMTVAASAVPDGTNSAAVVNERTTSHDRRRARRERDRSQKALQIPEQRQEASDE